MPHGFKFKILNFEPIIKSHIEYSMPVNIINDKLLKLGCQGIKALNIFRGQTSYFPFKKYQYKNIYGVLIEIGCGDEKVCKNCYKSNEIFITPNLQIKPCHIDDYQIDLNKFIKNKDENLVLNSLLDSRYFLAKTPGIGVKTWSR